MLKKSYLPLFFLSACIWLTAGCGSDNGAGTVTKRAASEPCIGCHNERTSPGTGKSIAAEWQLSTHNTANGAGCADCHEPGPSHPDSCSKCHGGSSAEVTRNPDMAQKCYKCHGLNHPDDIMIKNAPQHFGNMSASAKNTTFRASYVSSQYAGNCRKCHNPHNPTADIPINRQWAESGMGETISNARINYDFKTRGSYEPVNLTFQNICVRCHTTTGFIHFVTSGFSTLAPFAGPGYAVVQNIPGQAEKPSPDKSKEVTGCDACHDDGKGYAYGFKLRAVPPARIYYNYSAANARSTTTNLSVKINNTPVNYPDVGASNMCIPCHAGRGVGSMITVAAGAPHFLNFSTTVSISSHDFAGAGNLFRRSGYEYSGRDYTSGSFLHDTIGRNNTNGTGTLGPCITCHMKSDASHSFLPVAFDSQLASDPSAVKISGITSRTCANCHNGTINAIVWTKDLLQVERTGFHAALAVLNGLLNQKRDNVPGKTTTRTWEKLDGVIIKGTGPNTMGANFNYGALKNDWGAYVHNDLYAKRLIYDSIDWLYDRNLELKTSPPGFATDVEAAITTAILVKNPWSGKVYIDPELIAIKKAAVDYLLGASGGGRP
jgi:hypothetical protein